MAPPEARSRLRIDRATLLQALEEDDVVAGGRSRDGQAFAVAGPGKRPDEAVVGKARELAGIASAERLHPHIAVARVGHALPVWRPGERCLVRGGADRASRGAPGQTAGDERRTPVSGLSPGGKPTKVTDGGQTSTFGGGPSARLAAAARRPSPLSPTFTNLAGSPAVATVLPDRSSQVSWESGWPWAVR